MKSTTRRRPAISDEEKSHRRGEIMAAAKTVFARKGFHASTIADIAKEAGLAYGSIYWYFDSKEALFHALMAVEEEALRSYVASALAELGDTIDPEALFRTTVRATFEFFEADKASTKLLFRDASSLGEPFERHLGSMFERSIDEIETVVVSAQDRGDVVGHPPRMVAFTLAAMISQLALRRLSTDDGVGPDVVADFVVSLVLDGLLPRQRRPNRS